MTDVALRKLWGDELFDYCANKAYELTGNVLYEDMGLIAIGKLHEDGILVVKAKVSEVPSPPPVVPPTPGL